MSKGIMHLATASKEPVPSSALQAYIPLVGYPHPISSYFDKKQAEKDYKGENDAKVDEALTLDTYHHHKASGHGIVIPTQVDPASSKEAPPSLSNATTSF